MSWLPDTRSPRVLVAQRDRVLPANVPGDLSVLRERSEAHIAVDLVQAVGAIRCPSAAQIDQ